jgi:cystathionine beta-lyase/cystathionine gamma-synthase
MISAQELSYILYQLGEEDKPYRAISPPVVSSSNFIFDTVDDFFEAIHNDKDITAYSRGSNPTVRLLEKKVAALQGTEDALMFGSGSAAIAAAVISQVKAGDHVICVEHVYSWTNKLLSKIMDRFGVHTSLVDGSDPEKIKASLRKETKVLFLESPTSHTFYLQDLEHLVQWAHDENLIVIYDNSFGSLMNRKPVEYGIDIICHSASKYTSGHSDVVAGCVCGSREIIRKIYNDEYMTIGAILSPENAWLLIRSLRTLPMRMEQSIASCKEVVRFLKSDARIQSVKWPFDEDHPQYSLAKKQFDLEGPMFAFYLDTASVEVIKTFCNALRLIQMAVSWGGYESLLMPGIVIPGAKLPVNHIRLYIGFESYESIIDDLKQALDKAFA